jgi:hypothetical protein
MAILLANVAATLFMTGVGWFVQVVHYPLFGSIGPEEFHSYHEAHSRLTTRVVLVPMTVELITSAWLVVDRPAAVGAAPVWVGLALALFTWGSTVLVQMPQHRALGPAGVPALVALSWPRTVAWTAHSAVVLGVLAAAL